jgi:hypothetical protein
VKVSCIEWLGICWTGNGLVATLHCDNDLGQVLFDWGAALALLSVEWIDERPRSGNIDQGALNGVLLNWGNASAIGTAVGVPEPATQLLAILVVASAAVGRMKRKPVTRRPTRSCFRSARPARSSDSL